MSIESRLAKLEADAAASAVTYPPLYFPPQHIDPGVQSAMNVAAQENPEITDDELRDMARSPDTFYGPAPADWTPPHESSIEYAVTEARRWAAGYPEEMAEMRPHETA